MPEAVWALGSAVALVCFGLLPVSAALDGVGKGVDVYLFLVGMLLLAELARQEGLFDWLAGHAVKLARGSATRLFGLIYGVGIVVTVLLSNDATAVVLTPAVLAVTRAAKVAQPLPYLFICAFVANAASFVLPISNPANLVIYAGHMPPLLEWLPRFAWPSLLSIGVTYGMLRWTQRRALREAIAQVNTTALPRAGRLTAFGIIGTSLLLMLASALGLSLGLPTCIAGLVTLGLVSGAARCSPRRYLREVSWSVVPLVGGLFVLVEAVQRTGVIRLLSQSLRLLVAHSGAVATLGAGVIVGVVSNVINNLPAALIAAMTVHTADVSPAVTSAVLVGVDLGPNLSVTGSLATILWLNALRREGIEVKACDFLKLGLCIMPIALLAALVSLVLTGR